MREMNKHTTKTKRTENIFFYQMNGALVNKNKQIGRRRQQQQQKRLRASQSCTKSEESTAQ